MTSPAVLRLTAGGAHSREELGGKAWSIQRMLTLGIPVPPAFVLTTGVCRAYQAGGLPPRIWDDTCAAMRELERATGRSFGTGPSPLLVSVRSGAATSMPGMLSLIHI